MTSTPHPRLVGDVVAGSEIRDQPAEWPVAESRVVYDVPYARVRSDTIIDPGGDQHPRIVVQPHGAVGVLAIDEQDRVLLIAQYRHPVGHRLLEIPAGTLDVAGESGIAAAQRELAEEADLVAGRWESVLKLFSTPGYSSEQWECFVATDLSPVPETERIEREAEEADMNHWWVQFDEVLAAIAAGQIGDAMTVATVLAVHAQRTRA